jgi:hypothetical protein
MKPEKSNNGIAINKIEKVLEKITYRNIYKKSNIRKFRKNEKVENKFF